MRILIILSLLFTIQVSYSEIVSNFDETKVQTPLFESNETPLLPSICRERENSFWDYCSNLFPNDEEQMKSFMFTNWGENKIVPNTGENIGRSFEFKFEGLARSDMGLLVWDIPDQYESHGHLKLMMFFPRLVLPAIRMSESREQTIVTLPTKEEVIFNSATKEVVGGVFNEGPIQQDIKGNAIKPDVVYTGLGVVVEANRINDYPVGFNSKKKNNHAIIKKQGHKNCIVPIDELWYTDHKKGGHVFFNKKFITDLEFDKFLKIRCNFSMF